MEINLTVMPGQSTPVTSLTFPMLPESIRVMTGAIFADYVILKTGTIRVPSGRDLTGFSWSGILPGELRQDHPYVNDWVDPKQLQILWSIYQRDGTKLRLMITETPINHDVYIDAYDMTYRYAMGDYAYNLTLIHAIDLKISIASGGSSVGAGASGGGGGAVAASAPVVAASAPVTPTPASAVGRALSASVSAVPLLSLPAAGRPVPKRPAATPQSISQTPSAPATRSATQLANSPLLLPRPSPPATKAYTVTIGDSLYKVAQKMLGSGSRYMELYDINRDIIDEANRALPPPDTTGIGNFARIHPGQVLFVPQPAPNAPPPSAAQQKAALIQNAPASDSAATSSQSSREPAYIPRNPWVSGSTEGVVQ